MNERMKTQEKNKKNTMRRKRERLKWIWTILSRSVVFSHCGSKKRNEDDFFLSDFVSIW